MKVYTAGGFDIGKWENNILVESSKNSNSFKNLPNVNLDAVQSLLLESEKKRKS